MQQAKIRLYLDHPMGPGQSIPLGPDQIHYLTGVMRLGQGAVISVFNGRDGEWRAQLHLSSRKAGHAVCEVMTRPLQMPPDLWLLFSPIKKARTDFIVEKATELGVARILPVQTDFTNSERIRRDRLQAHAIEAAEQCAGTHVPDVDDLVPLARLLDHWPEDRKILWADEGRAGPGPVLKGQPAGPWAVLIGPEGGFSPAERARLCAMAQVVPVALGPRILRADTAVVAALALWQSSLGDWPVG